MVVLSSKPLWFKILEFIYNSPVVGHPGCAKIYKNSLMSILLAYNIWLYIKIYLSVQNVYLWKDFLYKEIRSILTVTNFNIKMAWYLN